MSRVRSQGTWVLAAVVVALLIAGTAPAATPDFTPSLRSQIPTSVKGTFQVVAPEIAIVIDHSSSMVEDIAYGKADFAAAEVFVDNPGPGSGCPEGQCLDLSDLTCKAAACVCTSAQGSAFSPDRGKSTSTYNFGTGGDPSAAFANPYYLLLACGDQTKFPPVAGSGWVTPEIPDVNNSSAAETSAGYFTRFPVGAVCSASATCSGLPAAKAVQFTAALQTALGFPEMNERRPLPQAAPAPDGLQTPLDGFDDTALFPFDAPSPFPALPYQPSASHPNPNNPLLFPYLDTTKPYNYPLRKPAPASSDKILFKRTKVRSAICAVAAFAGLDSTTSNCSATDGLWTNVAGTTDSFYATNVAGKAKLGVFKTNQTDPGWYPPLMDAIGQRKELPFRIVDFYPPGTDPDVGGTLPPCASGDTQCQRSALYLAPDIRRETTSDATKYPDCMGLGRLSGDGVAKAVAGTSALTTAMGTAFTDKFGIPGGVSGTSAILRDLYLNNASPGANGAGASGTGFWANDTSSCSAQNALILITDGLDSCSASTCASASPFDSSSDRLPGYAATPVAPFNPTCPSTLAATMLANTNKNIQTYVIGLDADTNAGGVPAQAVRKGLAKVASSGGTGDYYPARSFDELTGALRSIYSNITNQGQAVVTTGTFALGIAPSGSNLRDLVIDASFQPKYWAGYLRAQEIVFGGRPSFLWEAGQMLKDRDIRTGFQLRRLYTSTDKNSDGRISGDPELIRFDLFDDEARTHANYDLLRAGGTLEGAHPGTRRCLDNSHSTGIPFFLDAGLVYPKVGVSGGSSLIANCTGAIGSGMQGLGLANRDGTPSALVSYVYGYDNPAVDDPDCLGAPFVSGTGDWPSCQGPALGYRSRNFLNESPAKVWRLGDIVGSSPVIVGESKSVFSPDTDTDADGTSDFLEYQDSVHDRPRVVYVGANDGMLHAFNVDADPSIKVRGIAVSAGSGPNGGDAAGGEIFAYIPNEVLRRLKRYANPDYGTNVSGNWSHEASVDLTARIVDAKIYPGSEGAPFFGWRTVLVIGARSGGHYYAALDVTDPAESLRAGDKYPSLLWEFSDFNDTGHNPTTGATKAAATSCDTFAEKNNDAYNGHPECEDNGMDDDPWTDRLGETWAFPVIGRIPRPSGGPKWVMIVPSGPNTRENPSKVSSSDNANNDLHGYVWAVDLATGQAADIGAGAGPAQARDTCITTTNQDENAGPISGYPSSGRAAPFRTSPVGADIDDSNDTTLSGPTLDVLYWGDLGSRTWRGRVNGTTGALTPSIFFLPQGNSSSNCGISVSVQRPIVQRPSLSLYSEQKDGGLPRVWVFFSEGSLDFDGRDYTKGNFVADEFRDYGSSWSPSNDERAYRIFGLIDSPGNPPARYLDRNSQGACPHPDGNFTPGSCTNGSTSGDMSDRTCCLSEADVGCAPVVPDAVTRKGAFFVCAQTDPDLLPMSAEIPASGNAVGRGRVNGSPFIAAGGVLAEVFTPMTSTNSMCFEGGSTRIVAFDFNSGSAITWVVGAGAQQAGGSSSKYYVPPENPVTGSQGGATNVGPMPVVPPGSPPDFLRYEQVTGAGSEGAALPEIPLEAIYWKEVF